MSRRGRIEKAEEYFQRAPGYSAEAIEDMLLWSKATREKYPIASGLALVFAEYLGASHKFVLPVGGLTFDEDGFSQQMIESFRLPFALTTFEFAAPPLTGAEALDKFHVIYCPRRIALCFDTALLAVQHDEPSCFVWPISFIRGRWVPSWVGVRVPYMQTPASIDTIEKERFRAHLTDHGLRQESGAEFKVKGWAIRASYIPMGEFGKAASVWKSPEDIQISAMVDTRDELNAAIQACAALSCTNVTTEVIRPNREAHAIKPASTLFDYHVLVLKPGAPPGPSMPGDSTHASPRTHLRRGHIRRHPTAGRIWVNSCVVNPGAIGSVNKDYAIERPK